MKQRVVITGMGVSVPLGGSVETFWDGLVSGRSGIGPITLFDAASLPVRIGGEVRSLDIGRLKGRFPSAAGEPERKVWLGLDAFSQAVADAHMTGCLLQEAPLFVGVSLETFFLDWLSAAEGVEGFPALLLENLKAGRRIQTPLDRVVDVIGDQFGQRGGRFTNCSACAAGAQAIGEAFRWVREGDARAAVAGATDSTLNPLGLGGFSVLRILSEENDTPQQACRPFDATRQGTVLAEGSAFIVLESLESAKSRGAKIYAEMLGYGSSLDAFRVTDPEPEGLGATLSMRKAIADAGLDPGQIDCINAHGTGTFKNDISETRAIQRVFGERAARIPVTANKSMTGHMIASSGAAEAVSSILTLARGKIPPTINLRVCDPLCQLEHVSGVCREFSGSTVLSNSFGFGGQNATLVFGAPTPGAPGCTRLSTNKQARA
jgi:3-oxoacyl-[acyl-carrier-protein] synthase II